jgi:hypothetical protein
VQSIAAGHNNNVLLLDDLQFSTSFFPHRLYNELQMAHTVKQGQWQCTCRMWQHSKQTKVFLPVLRFPGCGAATQAVRPYGPLTPAPTIPKAYCEQHSVARLKPKNEYTELDNC